MKHIYLKTIFAALLLLCSSVASAHDFEVDGIFYNITDATAKTVEVTYKGNSYSEYDEYSGSVIIPSTVSYNSTVYDVTTIGEHAFEYCSLTSVEIPSSVTSIEIYAFCGCDDLIAVHINDIAAWCNIDFDLNYGCPLYYAKNLYLDGQLVTNLIIPNGVTEIKGSAFYGCGSLTSVTVPNSVTSIGTDAFCGCTGLTSITVNSGNSVYDSREGCNAIIETATNSLIAGCKNTIIPGSVTRIGYRAFKDCTGLTSIEIPNSVTSIGYDAFYGCSGLTSIEIPSSVTGIFGGAFWDCTGLASITVNSGNSVYDSREGCNAIIETATNTLIAGCKNTIIPGSVTSIGGHAFWGCSGLTSIVIPNSVTSIGSSAFYNCTGLTSVTIGNSVTSIGEHAFYYCSGLTNVTIPNSVTRIGNSAFRNCSGLTGIEFPNSVTNIGSYAFEFCTGLTSITIPNSVTSIEEHAFGICIGLTSITIPNSVTSIGEHAFDVCIGLTEVYVKAKTPPTINSSTFNNYTATLYVPYGTKSAYQVANYWKNFTNIVEMEPEFATGDINGDDEVNVGDFATLVNAIFDPENTDKAKYARADVNKDGEVNVGDFAALVNLIFGGSSNAAPKKAAATRATTGEHRLYIEPFSIAPGERAEIAVLMENTGDKFSQMQFDLTLPSGISIVQEFDEELFGDVPLIKHGSRTSSKAYDITCRPEGDGVKIMCATENINAYFLRESGDVLLITVEAAADLAFGTYELTISNSVLARQDDSTYKPASETSEITVCDLTGIDSIEAEDGAAEIYDIYGRRVTEPVKGGVYIVNGKKVVVE